MVMPRLPDLESKQIGNRQRRPTSRGFLPMGKVALAGFISLLSPCSSFGIVSAATEQQKSQNRKTIVQLQADSVRDEEARQLLRGEARSPQENESDKLPQNELLLHQDKLAEELPTSSSSANTGAAHYSKKQNVHQSRTWALQGLGQQQQQQHITGSGRSTISATSGNSNSVVVVDGAKIKDTESKLRAFPFPYEPSSSPMGLSAIFQNSLRDLHNIWTSTMRSTATSVPHWNFLEFSSALDFAANKNAAGAPGQQEQDSASARPANSSPASLLDVSADEWVVNGPASLQERNQRMLRTKMDTLGHYVSTMDVFFAMSLVLIVVAFFAFQMYYTASTDSSGSQGSAASQFIFGNLFGCISLCTSCSVNILFSMIAGGNDHKMTFNTVTFYMEQELLKLFFCCAVIAAKSTYSEQDQGRKLVEEVGDGSSTRTGAPASATNHTTSVGLTSVFELFSVSGPSLRGSDTKQLHHGWVWKSFLRFSLPAALFCVGNVVTQMVLGTSRVGAFAVLRECQLVGTVFLRARVFGNDHSLEDWPSQSLVFLLTFFCILQGVAEYGGTTEDPGAVPNPATTSGTTEYMPGILAVLCIFANIGGCVSMEYMMRVPVWTVVDVGAQQQILGEQGQTAATDVEPSSSTGPTVAGTTTTSDEERTTSGDATVVENVAPLDESCLRADSVANTEREVKNFLNDVDVQNGMLYMWCSFILLLVRISTSAASTGGGTESVNPFIDGHATAAFIISACHGLFVGRILKYAGSTIKAAWRIPVAPVLVLVGVFFGDYLGLVAHNRRYTFLDWFFTTSIMALVATYLCWQLLKQVRKSEEEQKERVGSARSKLLDITPSERIETRSDSRKALVRTLVHWSEKDQDYRETSAGVFEQDEPTTSASTSKDSAGTNQAAQRVAGNTRPGYASRMGRQRQGSR
ncbi:unnamed protein product [Amoebophrya sp. A120]|nr:unnamed protein product [Amoebophrya sp. A120]|eukprot:GSA120T00012933001.1